MAKGVRENIKMESTATKADGSKTGYFVTTVKNKKNTTGKLELMMFDPTVRKHVLFKETKLR
ncbi:MAG: 50S ribosomal protein L33 [Duodenibacillus sp.]|nr:50S ribosomal protein L33 [Duodenibacillus sp.]